MQRREDPADGSNGAQSTMGRADSRQRYAQPVEKAAPAPAVGTDKPARAFGVHECERRRGRLVLRPGHADDDFDGVAAGFACADPVRRPVCGAPDLLCPGTPACPRDTMISHALNVRASAGVSDMILPGLSQRACSSPSKQDCCSGRPALQRPWRCPVCRRPSS